MSYITGLKIVAVVVYVLEITHAATFDCYVCSYTRSTDPSVNYECVNGANTSSVRSCTPPYMCKTLALFNQEMTHVRSVTRDCLPQVDNCPGDRCCNKAGVYPLCEEKCRSNNCNSYNPEAWFRQPDSGDGESGGPSMGTNLTGGRWNILVVLVLSFAFLV